MYYIAMEYVGPSNLQNVLREAGGKLPLGESVRLVSQLLSALECAHERGVTHRDVKPANVLMSPERDAVLTDFSIASMQDAQRLTQTGAMVGTPDYMAPEQFDAKNVDKRSDLYATGIVLYEMLTGQRPFQGDTVSSIMKAQLMHTPQPPHELEPSIPAEVSQLILRAMEKQPEARFGSAAEMRRALLQAVGHDAAVDEPPPQRVTMINSGEMPAYRPTVPDPSPALAAAPHRTGAESSSRGRRTVEWVQEVSADFRSSFETVFWDRFSQFWLPRLLLLEAVWFFMTRLHARFLGKQAIGLTYDDFWMLGALLFNTLFLVMAGIRFLRRERLFRQMVAVIVCVVAWTAWFSQLERLEKKNYKFGQHARAYVEKVTRK
jgi:serine/threonine protein kinase